MKLLEALSRRTTDSKLELTWLMGTCCLLLLPFLTVLAEPRTFPLEGYFPSKLVAPISMVSLAVCVLAGCLYSNVPRMPRWTIALVALAPFADSMLGQIALLCLGLSSAISLVKSASLQLVRPGLALSGILFGLLWILYLVYGRLESQIDAGSILSSLVFFLSFGQVDVVSPGVIGFLADGRTEQFVLGFDKIGGLFFFALVAAYGGLAYVRRLPFREIAVDLTVCVIYAAVRCTLVFTSASGREEWIWWDEQSLLLTFAPLAIYLAWRLTRQSSREPGPPRTGHVLAALGVGGGCLLVFGFTFPALGTHKGGTVVIDESHSDWEDSRAPLNDVWFGSRTVYNYYNFRKELERHFKVEVAESGIDKDLLSRASVLVLKTPTKPYDDRTVKLVVEFVEAGGGLWLVGDHTNAFGMNTYLNKIASRLGCFFHSDAYIESPVRRNLWAPNSLSHPVARDLGTFLFYTGCSLSIHPLDTATMEARRMVQEPADYAAGSFFGPLRSVPTSRQGSVVMASVGERGAGRVALWSDSTLFSNFAIYMPGKLDVGLNTIEWLARRNLIHHQRAWAYVLGAILLCLAIAGRHGLSGLLGLVLGFGLAPIWLSAYKGIEPLKEVRTALQGDLVAFYEPLPTDHLPYLMAMDGEGPNFYVSAFVAAQRVGKRPFITDDQAQAFRASTIVMIGPGSQIGTERLRSLTDWVRRGGRLILLDGHKLHRHDLSFLSREVGASVRQFRGPQKEELKAASGASLGEVFFGFEVGRGRPIIRTESGKTICSQITYGVGEVIFSGTTSLFSDSGLGDVLASPNDKQFAAMQLLFGFLRKPTWQRAAR